MTPPSQGCLRRSWERSISATLVSYSLVSRYARANAMIGLPSVHMPSGDIPTRKSMPPMSPHFACRSLLSIMSARVTS